MADIISEKYKNLFCYQQMAPDDQTNFTKLAQHYGVMLNKGPKQSVTVYTAHDFDHHCFDLYRNISFFILKERGIKELSQEERYLLNISVLLHDISMCKGGYENGKATYFNRKIHSLQSAQWIRHEFDDTGSLLHSVGLTKKQIEIICAICQAHSDLKDRTDPSGLRDPKLVNCEYGQEGEVRVKALAGILRIADELDVTSQRLAGSDLEEALIQQPEDKRKESQIFDEENQESIKHFRRLKLICDLKPSAENVEQMVLEIDVQEVTKRLERGDEGNLAEDLQEIRKKIQRELDNLWSEVLCKPETKGEDLTKLKTVVWSPQNADLVERFDLDNSTKLYPTLSAALNGETKAAAEGEAGTTEKAASEETERDQSKDESPKSVVTILDSDLSKKIRQLVLQEDLLSVGHYQLNTVHCARDWIDTQKLLNNSPLSSTIINVFYNHIKTSFSTEKYTIVGLDLMGATTAAQIGFMLQKPFTYVIPAHQYSKADPHEICVPEISKDQKVILVTDSIVTGHTVSEVIEKNEWEDRVLAVYTVFYREPKAAPGIEPFGFSYAVNALNMDFPAEIALVSRCPFGKYPENCRAKNKKL